MVSGLCYYVEAFGESMDPEDLQDPRAATEKMPCIVIRVESDQIAMQDTEEDLIPHWENPVNLTARERSMQEEPYFDIRLRRSNLLS